MRVRKLAAAAGGAVFALGLMAGPVEAQDSPASVLPSSTVQVKGVQIPRTGSDLDAELFAGVALTAAGVVLAVTARERRKRYAAAVQS